MVIRAVSLKLTAQLKSSVRGLPMRTKFKFSSQSIVQVASVLLLSAALGTSLNAYAADDASVVPAEASVVPATNSKPAVDFDPSQKATYERCQQTKLIDQYLNSIPKDDKAKISELKAFLIDCQSLLTARIQETKDKIQDLQEATSK